jgi:hypothetical protein
MRESYLLLVWLSLSVIDVTTYTILRDRWCDIVLNARAATGDKRVNTKKSFYEELLRVLNQFPKYNKKISLGDFKAKIGTEDVLKPTTGNESLYEYSDDNGVRIVNFASSKI